MAVPPAILRTKACPRCGAENEVDAQYCNRCSLIVDEKLLHAKARKEDRTDEIMNELIRHPLVRETIKQTLRDLVSQAGSEKEA